MAINLDKELRKHDANSLNDAAGYLTLSMVVLLALSDEGEPYYSKSNASKFAALGIPVFACTPEEYPDLMAASLSQRDLNLLCQSRGIKMSKPSTDSA